MENYLFGWKAIQKHLRLSKPTILKRGYPVRKLGDRVCADREALDSHFQTLFRAARRMGTADARDDSCGDSGPSSS